MSVRPAVARRACARTVVALACAAAGLMLGACDPGATIFQLPRDHQHVLPPTTPPNNSPPNTLTRFSLAYQYQDITNDRSLFASDFHYGFSAQADSALVARYGNTWGKVDETLSAQHLLTGFMDSAGVYVAPASAVQLTFDNEQFYEDPAHADSARFFAYCAITTVNLHVDVPDSGRSTSYAVSAPMSFYFVRGDAAALDAGQPADSLHWYIRRWDDLAPPLVATTSPGLIPTTWGRLKVRYAN